MSAQATRFDPAGSSGEEARAARDRRLAELLQAAAGGDTAAFEAFYDGSIAYARALARRILPAADVDDLLADAYFESWRNAARFDAARGSALTWLLTLVRSRALDCLRRRATHPSVGGTDGVESDAATDPCEDPSEHLWRQQAGTRLHAALARLTPAERWVLGLAYFQDLTHSEIADCTGLPLGTLKSHLQRGRTKLRAALAAGA